MAVGSHALEDEETQGSCSHPPAQWVFFWGFSPLETRKEAGFSVPSVDFLRGRT